MNLFSLTFLFLFLPVSMAVYYLTPNKFKSHSLVLISALYIGAVDIKSLILLPIWAILDFTAASLIGSKKINPPAKKIILVANILKNLGAIIICSAYYQIHGTRPLFGIVVVSFLGMGYVIDIYKKEYAPDQSIVRYFCFSLFFPSLYFGPLTNYKNIRRQLTRIKPSITGISKGVILLISAFAKKVIIADTLIKLHTNLLEIPKSEFSVLTAWLLMLSFAFSIYFTLCGYFDAAKGIGLMFSLNLPTSFRYPFQARSLDDFFARFNISVNEYVRKYVYIQLGGKSNGTVSAIFNILLVSMLIAVWYGLKINCLLWGIYFAILIVLEQYVYTNFWKSMPIFLQRILTFAATIMSFSIMLGDNLSETWFYIKCMFGFGSVDLFDKHSLYLFSSNFFILTLAILISISLWEKVSRYFQRKTPAFWEFFSVFFNIGTLVCVCSLLV